MATVTSEPSVPATVRLRTREWILSDPADPGSAIVVHVLRGGDAYTVDSTEDQEELDQPGQATPFIITDAIKSDRITFTAVTSTQEQARQLAEMRARQTTLHLATDEPGKRWWVRFGSQVRAGVKATGARGGRSDARPVAHHVVTLIEVDEPPIDEIG